MLSIPKVILHEHLEGSVTANLAAHLSRKNGISLSNEYISPKNIIGDYEYIWDKSDFSHFIKIYDFISSLIKTPEDYYLVTADFISRNALAGMIYCELIISPDHMMKVGNGDNTANYQACLNEIVRAIKDTEYRYGTVTRLHAVIIRHEGAERVAPVVEALLSKPEPYLVGINVAGHEAMHCFNDYAYFLNQLYQQGLRGSLHAGEICGAESIKAALAAGASRIGHGIRALECPTLLVELIEKDILLEIALTSNHLLINDIRESVTTHPARVLYDKGVRINFNTDDAGIFATDICNEYQFAMDSFDFKRAELIDISLMAIEASFVSEPIKKRLLSKIFSVVNGDDISFFAEGRKLASSEHLRARFSKRYEQLFLLSQ